MEVVQNQQCAKKWKIGILNEARLMSPAYLGKLLELEVENLGINH